MSELRDVAAALIEAYLAEYIGFEEAVSELRDLVDSVDMYALQVPNPDKYCEIADLPCRSLEPVEMSDILSAVSGLLGRVLDFDEAEMLEGLLFEAVDDFRDYASMLCLFTENCGGVLLFFYWDLGHDTYVVFGGVDVAPDALEKIFERVKSYVEWARTHEYVYGCFTSPSEECIDMWVEETGDVREG